MELYASTLRSAGYVVETATNGDEAIERARRTNPALILMDLAMPQKDGWAAVDAIRHDAELKKAWVIAVTARSERHDHDRAYSVGCDAILLKPAEPSEILGAVASGLARAAARTR